MSASDGIPRTRRAPLPADALIVVRGEDMDPAVSRLQAERFRRRYPGWGRHRGVCQIFCQIR